MQDIFEAIFLKILNMSLTASYIILAVLIVRLLLKRAPKKYSYALWAVAGFRLVCPVSFKSVISIFSLRPFAMELEASESLPQAAEIVHIPADIEFMAQPEIYTGLPAVNAVVNDSLPAATPMYSANPMQYIIFFGMLLWMLGIVVMLTVSLVSLWRLRLSLRTATRLGEDVWQSENVFSPFIVGLFRPKIYIPYGLAEPRLGYVLAHERAHIRRLDHMVRTLAYLVLCLHWFNPLVWLAFHLMGRDMELSCDEKVLGRMGDKAEYSETLLSFATRRRFPAPTPLAFGESSVSQRIKNALKWHRPKVWVSAVALLLCVAVIVSCAANPKDDESGPPVLWGEWVPKECVYLTPVMSWFPFGGDNGLIYSINEDGIRVDDHESGDFLYGYGALWGWQDFPYSDEEWQEMFLLYENNFAAPISSLYDEVLYQPLIGNRTDRVFVEGESEVDAFLMLCDGELWFVSTNKDSKGQKLISSIYALQKQEELGMASFAYPDGTSNEPGIEISFADHFESVKVSTSGGCVSAFANGDTVGGADTSTVVPEGGSFFWCPIQNDSERPEAYNLAQSAVIRLSAGNGTQMCSIYVSYDDGVYTLRPVGKGVELFQTGEKTAELDFGAYAYADTKVSPTDIPAGSPWALFAGLDVGSVSSLMIDGDPAAVLNSPELEVLKVQVVEALLHVEPDEVYIGRGGPWQWTLSLGIDDGESEIKLGYCGELVEVQLEGAAAEAYPADGGVWVIRNAALTELLQSLTRSAVTEFEFSLSPNRYADSGLAVRLDVPDADRIEITSYARSFSENGSVRENSASEELWGGFDVILRPALDSDGNNYPDLLAESGGLLFTVWQDGKYAQCRLFYEGANLRPTPDSMGKTADYSVYLEGPFEASADSENGVITLSIDEDWLKPTPQYYLSTLKYSDVAGFELNGELDGRILAAGLRDQQLVKILAAVEPGEVELRQSGLIAHSCEAVLETDYTSIVLRYMNGEVELSFPDGKFDAAGVWYIVNDELSAFFEGILARAAEEFDILSGDAEDVKSIYLQAPAWQANGSRVMLDEAAVEKLLKLLGEGKKTVMAYPGHEASMQASIWYTLTLTYESENGDINGDLIYIPSEGGYAYRLTGTYGSGGDPGYVRVESDELWETLKSLAGMIDRDELPGLTISFTNFSGTEATSLGVDFASGEGVGPSAHSSISRGGYTSSKDIEPMEKGVEYVSTYSAKSLGAVAGFETVYISFELDGRELGTYAFDREALWGGTLKCSLSEGGEFSAELQGYWDTTIADIYGESAIFGYADMSAAIDAVLEYMENTDPEANVTLMSLGYDEALSQKKADAFAKQYGDDEAIVLVSSFEVERSWGAFTPQTYYRDWEWVLTRQSGGDWVLRTWGYG